LEAHEERSTATPPEDARGRRRLAEVRMWQVSLLRQRDPARARALLDRIDATNLEGAPKLQKRLATLRQELSNE
ncbi:MAG: hypothetical protein KC457_18140, partial [Myxococcales bacterium]|nr:hypothetical protein [Myxococcales bacterium]